MVLFWDRGRREKQPMTKPLSIEVDGALAEKLARVANDLGETQEQFVPRAVAARLDVLNANSFFRASKEGL